MMDYSDPHPGRYSRKLAFLRLGRGPRLHLLHFRRISQSSRFKYAWPPSSQSTSLPFFLWVIIHIFQVEVSPLAIIRLIPMTHSAATGIHPGWLLPHNCMDAWVQKCPKAPQRPHYCKRIPEDIVSRWVGEGKELKVWGHTRLRQYTRKQGAVFLSRQTVFGSWNPQPDQEGF